MSDAKPHYSEASSEFVEIDTVEQEEAKRLYEKSKVREDKHNDEWKEHPVNINDIVDEYAPGAKGEKAGVKYIFKGERYNVIADMASGYLRVQDTVTNTYLKFDGSFVKDDEGTHFKIKRKEEM